MPPTDETSRVADYCNAGDIVHLDTPIGNRFVRVADSIRYDYEKAATRCPVCKHMAGGMPWGGWFLCEYRACCVARVDTGEVFVPMPKGG